MPAASASPNLPQLLPVISVENLVKTFGHKSALNGMSFSIPAGQICGLLGPNGAGKTTLFRLMMGILKPTSGRLTIDGLDAFEDRVVLKRSIGFLPDEPVFYAYLSARETLQLSAAMHGLDVPAAMASIQPLMDRMQLTAQIDEFAEEYSRGMKKKLGLLLALLHRPKLLILDEPTNGLDVEGTHLFYDLIVDIAAQGTTILLSTHLMDQVARLCSHVVVIDRGGVVAQGGIDALRAAHGEKSLEDVFRELTQSPMAS